MDWQVLEMLAACIVRKLKKEFQKLLAARLKIDH